MSDDSDLDRWLATDDDPAETPDAPEASPDTPAPTPEASAPDDPATSLAAGVDRGDGRDVNGRWVGKGEEPNTVDAGATHGAVAATPATDAAPVPDSSTGQPAPTQATEVADPSPPAEPLVVKYRDQEFEIPGSRVTPEGVFIPAEQREILSAYLGKGIKLDAERATLRKEQMDLRMQVARAAASNTEIDKLVQIVNNPDDQAMAEAVLMWALDFRARIPLLQEHMQLEQEKAALALQRELAMPDPDEQVAQVEQAVHGTIEQSLAQYFAHETLKGLTPDDQQRVRAYAQANARAMTRRAGQRLTAEEQALGVKPGEIYVDDRSVLQYAQDLARVRQDANAQVEQHKAALEEAKRVAAANAAKLAKAAPAPQTTQTTKATAKPVARPVDPDEDFEADLHRTFAEVLR